MVSKQCHKKLNAIFKNCDTLEEGTLYDTAELIELCTTLHKKKNKPKKEVTGASELQHQIKAAAPVTAQGESKTAYVYTGNLEKDTKEEEEDLGRHLTDIGVQYTLDEQ